MEEFRRQRRECGPRVRFTIRRTFIMRQSFHPVGWWKIVLGGLAGAALVSGISLGEPWLAAGGAGTAEREVLAVGVRCGRPARSGEPDHAREGRRRGTPGEQRADLPTGTALRTRHADSGQTALQPDDSRTADRAAHRVEQHRSRMMSWSAVRSARSGPNSTDSATLASASTARTISTTATNCPNSAIRTV